MSASSFREGTSAGTFKVNEAGRETPQRERDPGSISVVDEVPRLWQEGDPYRFSPKRRGDPWEESMKRVDQYDDEMCRAWKEDIDTLLVFAGLFSSVVTGFVAQSYPWLAPNDQVIQQNAVQRNSQITAQTNSASASAIRINAVWFLSLILALSTVLLGILCKQWLREHRRDTPTSSSKELLELRQLRFESLEKWGVPALLASLPLMLQIALVLFFYGLLDLLWSLNFIVAAICTVATVISVSIPFLTTILPAYYLLRFPSMIYKDEVLLCPHKSPQAWLFYRLIALFTWSGKHRFEDWASSDLYLLRNHTPNRLHHTFLLRGLRWMVKTFCDSTVMANHIFHCFQNLSVDVAAFAIGKPEELSQDAIYYHFFRNSSWDPDIGKFLAELFLRQINSPSRTDKGVGDALVSFWNLAVVDFVGDGHGETPQVHLEFLRQAIASIKSYCADNRITLLDMNPLMVACKELWRHSDLAIRQQSIGIFDEFGAWISRTSEELQREFVPSFASSITEIICSEDERAPNSALILSERGRAFIRYLDWHLVAHEIDMDRYSLQEMPMSWHECKMKVMRVSGISADFFDTPSFDSHAMPVHTNTVSGSLCASDTHTVA
ncbi:hypothetical protein BDP27DRAFT_1415325 [Rhodocollybia butyracea]|uniref:DUF6535 domain-containing protein n=1 Tax=Rhodocollybia butyracea TaxID=206335 RepID=A0A9P5UCV3_9AGAR|nr:hypothetical protein BDP27DRAFT_1415325 [Rhodocollybia butyracea]